MSNNDDDLVEIGHILGVHGVKGQVKVFSNTSPRENIVTYSPWIIKHRGLKTTFKVSGNCQGKNVVARLEGVNDRNQAQEMTGARIFISNSQLPHLTEGEYYWSQLMGLQVISTENIEFGYIDHLLETGANDVMVVQGDKERLIPYVMNEVIKSIDLDKRQIIVDWDADF